MKLVPLFAVCAVLLESVAASAGSVPGNTNRPATLPSQANPSVDYQQWLHRHDGLRQFNPPSATTPRPQADYQLWLHRHDGLRQFNSPGLTR